MPANKNKCVMWIRKKPLPTRIVPRVKIPNRVNLVIVEKTRAPAKKCAPHIGTDCSTTIEESGKSMKFITINKQVVAVKNRIDPKRNLSTRIEKIIYMKTSTLRLHIGALKLDPLFSIKILHTNSFK
jgi:hypothetical protein